MRVTLQRPVETLRPGLSQLPYLLRTLALVWDVSPRLTTAWVVLLEAELVQDHISNLIHAKSTEVDLAFYDLPDYFDQLHRAQQDASYRPVALLEGLGSLLQNGITLVAMAVILIPCGWWLPLALLLSTAPALFVVVRYTLRQYHWWLVTTPDQRRTSYYDWLLTTRETAAELRLFQLGPHFQSSYQTLRQRLRGERLQLLRDQGLADLLASASGLVVTGVVMFWMVWQTLQGLATLGDLWPSSIKPSARANGSHARCLRTWGRSTTTCCSWARSSSS